MAVGIQAGGVSLRVTERAHYGLRMMAVLAQHYDGQDYVSLRMIADLEHLPHPFLEQLTMPLRRANLVTSIRGVKGGYLLARSPAEITLYDIITATDGPIAPVECLSPSYVEGSCPMDQNCTTANAWSFLQVELERILKSRTLADVVASMPRHPRAKTLPLILAQPVYAS